MDIQPLFPEFKDVRPIVIAGPCSAESLEQVMNTALALAHQGIKIFRAGIWKPRTKPGSFEGVGDKGLKWLQQVKQETGMYSATEVATPSHVEMALKHQVDLLWIGARTGTNPFATQEIAEALKGTDIPVLVKNPINPDSDLWAGSVERMYNAGIKRLGVIHRGFSSYVKKLYRNQPQWHIPIELRRRFPELPVFCDPSHIGGRRELIAPLSQQAMDLNFDGLMIEAHCCPDQALSDKHQQVTPEELSLLLKNLTIRDANGPLDDLRTLRSQIDEIDNHILELISKRMSVSREIGLYKKQHNLSILQTMRYDEILRRMTTDAETIGINSELIKTIMQAIHEESARQQWLVTDNQSPSH